MAGHRVLLVREWDEQLSSSGCCGRLGGIGNELGEPATYAHTRRDMEGMGIVYRALRALIHDDIEITVVDPRNTVWLVPALWRDAGARGASLGERLQVVRRGVSRNAVIADGRVLFAGGSPPAPDDVVAAVQRTLAEAP